MSGLCDRHQSDAVSGEWFDEEEKPGFDQLPIRVSASHALYNQS